MKRSQIVKNCSLVLSLMFILVLSGCEKHVTPNKVNRVIKEDTWRINSLKVEGVSIQDQFINQSLEFGEDGIITIIDAVDAHGTYKVGIDKKPTHLYISGILDAPYSYLNDDWSVLTCDKNRITMESDNGTYIHELSISRIE